MACVACGQRGCRTIGIPPTRRRPPNEPAAPRHRTLVFEPVGACARQFLPNAPTDADDLNAPFTKISLRFSPMTAWAGGMLCLPPAHPHSKPLGGRSLELVSADTAQSWAGSPGCDGCRGSRTDRLFHL